MTALDDLLDYICDGKRPELYSDLEAWIQDSRRFRAFASTYRDKIRAKLRNVRDEGGQRDLRAELETAWLLLHEERFTLEYEKYAASKLRGPDFTVTFKTHTLFNVEVRRMRGAELDERASQPHLGQLIAVLCDKVGQMQPGVANLLWLIAEREMSDVDLTNAAADLRQLADDRAEDFFVRHGFASAADFLKK